MANFTLTMARRKAEIIHRGDAETRRNIKRSQTLRARRWPRSLVVVLIAALGPASIFIHAQEATSSEILGANPNSTTPQQCTGPLGSLLPECIAGKTSINIASPKTDVNTSTNLNTRIPSSKRENTEGRETVAPEPVKEPPTEFQRLAASSVGEMLPIFGASLFEKVPTTFAPLDRVPVTSDYVIGPGDELLLRVWGQVGLNAELTVDRSGAVFIPQAGTVNVAGLQYQQLPGYLRSQLERVFRNFDFTVNMGQLRSVQIFVMGQARRPGTYTVSSLSTMVNALFASGGPSAQGSMRKIQLKRGAQVVTQFDLYDLLLNGDKSKDERVLPGDVVYIPPVGPQVAVAGSVKNPGIYEIGAEKTAGELIQLAGGLSPVADARRATLERIKQHSSRETVELQLDSAGLATRVGDGDLLHVLTIAPHFDNAVTLRGNVANPGRFPWRQGLRLRDIIPDKDSLVTRDYWNKRNLLGFSPPAETTPVEPVAEIRRKPPLTKITTDVPDINWSYAVIERQNLRDLSTELIPFHLGKLVLERDDSQNLDLRPGDVVTVFSQADFRVSVSQQTRMVRLEGEFNSAGIYAVRPGETLGQLVQRVGGLTPQAYLFGAEFQRESARIDQQRRLDQFVRDLEAEVEQAANLRMGSVSTPEDTTAVNARLATERQMVERMRGLKATGRIVLNLEPGDTNVGKLMNLTLEDGDSFLVPARPATVNVLGAVYNQNSFVHEPGLRIADYLREAGGATRNADSGHIFVIRADGSVVPKQGAGLFTPAFETARLNPGDSIVVPEVIFKTSFMRGLRDWTQVLSQLALGAAVVNVLK